jgi:hypothetical protein
MVPAQEYMILSSSFVVLMQDHQTNNLKDQTPGPAIQPPPSDLAAVFSSNLVCWSCKYDLTGLSVTGNCPECGTPVRATLLAIVDPKASSFEPLRSPSLSAIGLLIWSGAAFTAILIVALLRLADIASLQLGKLADFSQFGVLVPIMAGLSGIGALAFVKPHRAIRAITTIRSLIAVSLYVPLVIALWNLHVRFDVVSGSPYFNSSIGAEERVVRRISIGFLILVIALLLRTAAREFAVRSVLMRTGQLSRQTLLAFASAVLLTILGDTLHLVAIRWPAIDSIALTTIWMALVVIGSGLIAVGFGGMLWDSIRLYPVIRRRPRSLGEVIRKECTSSRS